MSNDKIFSLSLVRVIASIAVVFISSFSVAKEYTINQTGLYTASSVMHNIFLWAIPMFIMVSGALLLNSNRTMTYKHLFKDYILKVAVALVVFTTVNTIIGGAIAGDKVGDTFKAIFRNMISGGGWSHMWYLYMLIAMYLTLPLFRIFVKNTNNKTYLYIMGVMFVTSSLLPALASSFGTANGIHMWTSGIYPFYFLSGYYLFNNRHRIWDVSPVLNRFGMGKYAKYISFAGIAVLLIGIINIIITTVMAIPSNVSSYAYPLTVIMSMASFLFITTSGWANGNATGFLKMIDETTFGIYLFHMIYIKLLFAIFNPMTLGGFGIVVVMVYAVLSYVLSFVVTFALKRIKVVSKFL